MTGFASTFAAIEQFAGADNAGLRQSLREQVRDYAANRALYPTIPVLGAAFAVDAWGAARLAKIREAFAADVADLPTVEIHEVRSIRSPNLSGVHVKGISFRANILGPGPHPYGFAGNFATMAENAPERGYDYTRATFKDEAARAHIEAAGIRTRGQS